MYPTELQYAELFIDVASSWHHHWQQLSMTRTAILAQFRCQTAIQEISLHRYSRSIACSFSSVLSCPTSTSVTLIVKFSQVESWFFAMQCAAAVAVDRRSPSACFIIICPLRLTPSFLFRCSFAGRCMIVLHHRSLFYWRVVWLRVRECRCHHRSSWQFISVSQY